MSKQPIEPITDHVRDCVLSLEKQKTVPNIPMHEDRDEEDQPQMCR